MNNTKAFTLIELLVVVLIIGILAAVALPQYQQAVEKSRAAEAMANISSFAKAVEVWKLANPGIPDRTFTGYGTGVGQLDIDIPADWIRATHGMIAENACIDEKSCSKNFCYEINSGYVQAYRANSSTYQYEIHYLLYDNIPYYRCNAHTKADLKLCNSLSNMKYVLSTL